jgi:hypothetical protein
MPALAERRPSRECSAAREHESLNFLRDRNVRRLSHFARVVVHLLRGARRVNL